MWYKTKTALSPTLTTLEKVFRNATTIGEGQFFFDEIWIPLRTRDNQHQMIDNSYTYQNVGVSTYDMTLMYNTLYGRNFLSVPLILPTQDVDKYDECVDELSTKMKSILNLYLYKYLKWIETMGYAYNPLWNVDGTESFQYIDSHGKVTRKQTPILKTSDELQTTPFDNTTYRNTEKTTTTYSGTFSTDEEEHTNVVTDSIDGPVHAITGGDYSHIEKRIRQGNIGVTQTTQLIESERNLVKFNIIQEFFNDINKQLLIGIYA